MERANQEKCRMGAKVCHYFSGLLEILLGNNSWLHTPQNNVFLANSFTAFFLLLGKKFFIVYFYARKKSLFLTFQEGSTFAMNLQRLSHIEGKHCMNFQVCI